MSHAMHLPTFTVLCEICSALRAPKAYQNKGAAMHLLGSALLRATFAHMRHWKQRKKNNMFTV